LPPLKFRSPSLLFIFFIVLVASIANSSHAQDHSHAKIVFFGKQPPSSTCLHKLQTLQRELRHFPFPNYWTLGVACDLITWETALRRAEFPPTDTAFTGIKPRLTVLNGEIFNQQPNYYEHTLAHELGHVRCYCVEESRAEEIGMRYLKSPEYLTGKNDDESPGIGVTQ
jgi:hypothetical protein